MLLLSTFHYFNGLSISSLPVAKMLRWMGPVVLYSYRPSEFPNNVSITISPMEPEATLRKPTTSRSIYALEARKRVWLNKRLCCLISDKQT